MLFVIAVYPLLSSWEGFPIISTCICTVAQNIKDTQIKDASWKGKQSSGFGLQAESSRGAGFFNPMCLWKTWAEQKNDSPVLEKNFTGTQGKHLLYRKESEWKNREDSKMRREVTSLKLGSYKNTANSKCTFHSRASTPCRIFIININHAVENHKLAAVIFSLTEH